jgi:hypothetical protein
MNRRIIVVLAVLFTFALLVSDFSIVPVNATPINVGTSTTSISLNAPTQRYLYYILGRVWAFYNNGTHLVLRTKLLSESSFGNDIPIRACTPTYSAYVSVWLDENDEVFHYAYFPASDNTPVYYRAFKPYSDGSISWLDEEQIALPGQSGVYWKDGGISTDSNGYPWIMVNNGTSNDISLRNVVVKSDLKNGTWLTSSGFPYVFSTANTFGGYGAIPLTSGKMLLVYGASGAYINSRPWDGTSWGTEKVVISCRDGRSWSAVANGDTVYLVAETNDQPYPLKFLSYSYSSNSWSTATTILDSADLFYPMVSLDSNTGNLYCFWMNATSEHVYYKTKTSSAWLDVVDWITETDITSGYGCSSFYKDYNSKVLGIIYLTGANPYTVKYAEVPLNPPSIGEFQAPTTVYANHYFFLNATVNDDDGIADLVNVTVELSNGVILKWDNATDVFSEFQDTYGYCTLDASNSFKTTVNSTAYKLSWKIKLTWNYPEGNVSIISANTKVFDSKGASGSASYSGLFTFEDDLIVSSASVDDSRVNPSQSITFTGQLCYQGTNTPPEDVSGITAKVALGETVKGSTTTINSTGHFQITFNAETGFQLYSYTVFAVTDENTVQNQTVNVIVDRLIVTIAANTTNPAPYSYVSFTVTAIYDYDDSPVTSWTVNVYRNSTYFATGNFTDGGYNGALYLYTTENVTENVYGLTGFTSNTVTVYWSTYVALTVQTKDLDNNLLTDAIVYFNETEVPVDSQGYAIKTNIVQYNVLAVKVKWQGCWVNGTWTVNMTETKTIVATCNVWSLLVIARDSESTLFTSSNLQLSWTAPNATSNLLATSDGTWTFKTANGTSYYMVKFFDVWVTSNTSIAMSNKNITVLYLNCNAYPFMIGSAKYHWASNATADTYTWNDTSLMLQIFFNSSPDNYTLVADSPRPTYILNVSYSMPTCYTSYLCLAHYGNATLTISYESWGDFYISSVDHKLSSISWAGQVLTLTIEGETGENGTLTVYCGSRGGPRQQQGLTGAAYNADTKILSGLYVFASQVTVTLDWTTAEGGPSGGQTTIGTLQVTIEDVSLSLPKGKTETFNLTIHWSGVNDITITKVTVTEEYVTWFSLTETLPKYVSKTSAETEGTITVTLKVSVPWQTTLGQHTIPVTISVQQQGGITIEKSGVIYLTITSGEAAATGFIPQAMTYLFLFLVAALSAYAFIKKR